MSKVFSPNLRSYFRSDLGKIVRELKVLGKVKTIHFEGFLINGLRNFAFVGKDNRPHLLKCLWTLESEGIIENINLGFNQYEWQITEKGINSDF